MHLPGPCTYGLLLANRGPRPPVPFVPPPPRTSSRWCPPAQVGPELPGQPAAAGGLPADLQRAGHGEYRLGPRDPPPPEQGGHGRHRGAGAAAALLRRAQPAADREHRVGLRDARHPEQAAHGGAGAAHRAGEGPPVGVKPPALCQRALLPRCARGAGAAQPSRTPGNPQGLVALRRPTIQKAAIIEGAYCAVRSPLDVAYIACSHGTRADSRIPISIFLPNFVSGSPRGPGGQSRQDFLGGGVN